MSESRRKPEAILRRLEWTVIRRLDGVLQGNYRTLFRGSGLDLAGLREYQSTDDIRHIDWNVTARTGEPFVRQYHEDREITAWFLLDLSPSVDFGSAQAAKREILIDTVGVLGRLLTRYGNRVGAVFYGDGVESVIHPKGGRMHVLHILDKMLKRKPLKQSQATSLSDLLGSAFQMIRRRSLVFLISDFISTPGWEKPLVRLSQRQEILAVRLYDPLEMALPDLGLFVMQDSETGEQVVVDSHDKAFRRRFAEAAARRENEIRGALASAGVDALELSTEEDLADALFRFAQLRKKRSQLVGGGTTPARRGGDDVVSVA